MVIRSLVLALGAVLCTSGCDAVEPSKEASPESDPPRDVPGEPEPPRGEVEPPALPPASLDPARVLVRASLDVRGIRPTEEEARRIADDPDALDPMIDAFVDDVRFGRRMRDLFAPAFRTRVDGFRVFAETFGLDDEVAFRTSLAEEPLALVGRIAERDLPWTELVTADYAMSNDVLEQVFDLESLDDVEADDGAPGFKRARYLDGRVHSGVLSASAIFVRYPSDDVNYNRGRANALSSILLCDDYLDRPVDFPRDVDLTDEDGVLEAVRTNDGCTACHATLDPFASYLFGYSFFDETAVEYGRYHPEREGLWRYATGVAPGYYGDPGFTIRDLGQQIAADPRFVDCAVRRVYEGLFGRRAEIEDIEALIAHRESFLRGGLTLRSLARSILKDSRYRGADAPGDVRPHGALKMVRPTTWSTELAELTGAPMTILSADLMHSDDVGIRMLGGGDDPQSGAAPAAGPGVTRALALQRIAEIVAVRLVDGFDPQRTARVFGDLDLDAGAPAASDVADVRARIVGRAPGAVEAVDDELVALFTDVEASGETPRDAWAAVIEAILRDPDFTTY